MLGDLGSIGHDELPLEEFRRWWAEVPGQAGGWNQQTVGGKRTVQLQGAAQLKAPWLADTWLRLTPFDVQELSLVFWTSDKGIALVHYRQREPHLWAAFAVERGANAAEPQRWGLLTTDSGAVYRSGVATLEFHHHANALVMSVAQVPVLTVPLSGLPSEVVLMGRTRLRGASWVRADPLPPRADAEHSIAWSAAAQEIRWQTLPGGEAAIERADDGSLTLRSEGAKDLVGGISVLPKPGLYEVVFRILAGDPGTGVVLGDAAGRPVALLGLLKERRTGQHTLAGMRPEERRTESDYDRSSFPPPYLAPGQWVRLTAGLGALQVCVSGDGRHWGHVVESPVRDVRGAIQSVGLFALPSDAARRITVDHLQVRRLDGPASLVDAAQFAQAKVDPAQLPRDLGAWQQLALEQRPTGAATADWLDACALTALEAGPPAELVGPLVERLAESLSSRAATPQQRWTMYGDLMQITDHWPEREANVWARRFADSLSAAEAWSAWLQAPVWTHGTVREEFQRGLTRDLLEASEHGQWDAVDRLSRFALHSVSPAHPDHQPRDAARPLEQMARWARGVAGDVSATPRESSSDVFPLAWRHPFQPQLDKDAYNTRAELQSALESGAYRDAARIAISLGDAAPSGLLPDVRDPRLFVSLPVALSVAWRDHPAFGETMRKGFTDVGLLRVRQAMERTDVAALDAATLQFFGTAAAAEAHGWLGDRQLSLGEFASARRSFELALPTATDEQRRRLIPRLTLAKELSGPLPGERNSAANPAIEATLEGTDLAPVIRELRSIPPALSRDILGETTVALPPQRYRLEPRARFDGQAGQNAGQGEFRNVDAFGRQFGVADAERLYVSNRFQVTAFDRAGQSKWAVAVGSEQGAAHAHRFTPMTPLVVGDALYLRRLTKAGVELAALDAASGALRWHNRPGDQGQWLSDPLWTTDGLWALAAHKLDDERVELRWSQLESRSGAIVREVALFRLRDVWQGEIPCRIAARGWHVVAAVGGATACFTLHGELRWVRQELWLPPTIDPAAADYVFSTPLVSDRDVIGHQPGCRTVRCVDLTTGQTKWNWVSPALQGILAATNERVLLADSSRIAGLDRQTGATAWEQPIDKRLTALGVSGGHLVCASELPFKGNRGWLNLIWIDLASGEIVAETPVDADQREDWRFGPLFAVDEQVWAFSGQSWRDPHRDLVALTPIAGSGAGPWHDPLLGAWQSPTSADERRAAQTVLPGWCPIGPQRDALSVASNEVRGRTPVLVSRVKKGDALQFLRHLAVPKDGAASLRVRVGHQPGQRWRLEVRVDSQMVVDQNVEEASSTDGWVEHVVPLGTHAGRTVLVQVAQRNSPDQSAEGLWHQLALTPQ
jgi:outer membrane protein assembly factor BamB